MAGKIIKLTTTTTEDKDEEEEGSSSSNGIRVRGQKRLSKRRVHLYVNRSSRFNQVCLNADRCFNVTQFTLRYKEKHILLTDAAPSLFRAVFNDDDDDENSSDVVLKIDATQAPLQKAYQVQVKSRNTTVTVDFDTKLSDLIDLSCLDVEHLVLTNQQLVRLL